MALDAQLESIEGLPPEIAKEYSQVNGEGLFTIDITPRNGFGLEDVVGLKKNLSDRTEKHKKASERITKVDSVFGEEWTGESLQTLFAELEGLRAEGSDEEKFKTRLESALKPVNEKHTKTLGDLQGSHDQMFGWLKDAMLSTSAKAELASHTKDANIVSLLLPHVLGMIKLRMPGKGTEDKPTVIIPDAEGNPRLTMESGSTSNMTLKELIEEMADSDKFSQVFKASGAAGGGSGDPGGAGSVHGNQLIISREDASDVKLFRAATKRANDEGKELVIKG